MARSDDEDLFEGEFGRRRAKLVVGDAKAKLRISHASKRARAAWYNRPRGAGSVKLVKPRAAGSQRVIVKLKPVVHARVGGGAGGLMRHALYVERDGAGRDGDEVRVFDRELDRADGSAFVERCEGDRHHFRVILSPEHGADMADLKSFTRELMTQVETDLRTDLDWIAAEHHDTGHAHVHLLIRGRRDDGRDLIIPRPYVSHTFRERAEAIVTRELGPRLERGLGHDLDQAIRRSPNQARLTEFDDVLRAAARGDEVSIADLPAERRSLLVERLNRLEDWKLAERLAANCWRLDPALEDKLVRLGDSRDRKRALARLMTREDRGLEPERTRSLEDAHSSQRVTGKLVGFEKIGPDVRGPYLIGVEGVDGHFWTARVGHQEELRWLNGVEHGAIVSIHLTSPELRASDRTIIDIASEDGIYSAERHRAARPTDRDSYIRMHERRLEALRRGGIVERAKDGRFLIPADYEAQILAREGRDGRQAIEIRVLDPQPLETQIAYQGPTWLDQADQSQIQPRGFGRETIDAIGDRLAQLEDWGLARTEQGRLTPDPEYQRSLRAWERDEIRQQIEQQTGRTPHFARDGERVEGIFAGRIHKAGKSFALILQEKTATLAPWKPAMDRAFNQRISGQVNGQELDFKYGREAGKTLGLKLGLGIEL